MLFYFFCYVWQTLPPSDSLMGTSVSSENSVFIHSLKICIWYYYLLNIENKNLILDLLSYIVPL